MESVRSPRSRCRSYGLGYCVRCFSSTTRGSGWHQEHRKKASSKSKDQTFALTSAIHALETGFHAEEHPAHRFEVHSFIFCLLWSLKRLLYDRCLWSCRHTLRKNMLCIRNINKIYIMIPTILLLDSKLFSLNHHWWSVILAHRKYNRMNVCLKSEPIPYNSAPPPHLPRQYGSYHQLYRLDGELIAIAVLDILPHCVSSVYFMYDKKWERFSFGKVWF